MSIAASVLLWFAPGASAESDTDEWGGTETHVNACSSGQIEGGYEDIGGECLLTGWNWVVGGKCVSGSCGLSTGGCITAICNGTGSPGRGGGSNPCLMGQLDDNGWDTGAICPVGKLTMNEFYDLCLNRGGEVNLDYEDDNPGELFCNLPGSPWMECTETDPAKYVCEIMVPLAGGPPSDESPTPSIVRDHRRDLSVRLSAVEETCKQPGRACRVTAKLVSLNDAEPDLGRARVTVHVSSDAKLDKGDKLLRSYKVRRFRSGDAHVVHLSKKHGATIIGEYLILTAKLLGGVSEHDRSNNVAIVRVGDVTAEPYTFSTYEPNRDRAGRDYKRFWLSGTSRHPKFCEEACIEDARCSAWTYVKPGVQGPAAVCWLKKSVPSKSRNTSTTSGVVHTVEPGVDRPGGDYKSVDLSLRAQPKDCNDRCASESRCRAWTFVPAGLQGDAPVCWLKDRIPAAKGHYRMTSGFVG